MQLMITNYNLWEQTPYYITENPPPPKKKFIPQKHKYGYSIVASTTFLWAGSLINLLQDSLFGVKYVRSTVIVKGNSILRLVCFIQTNFWSGWVLSGTTNTNKNSTAL